MRLVWHFSLGVILCAPLLAGAEMYRWVDENGRIHYGDRIPPKYAKSERDVLDNSGVVRETLGRELTPEELAAKREQERLAEEQKIRAAEQEKYDKFLLSTYETPGDLVSTRDDRLETLDGQIVATKKTVADTERILGDLHARAKTLEDQNRPIPTRLREQIVEWDKALVKGVSAITRLQEDRDSTAARFDSDLRRYLELRGITPHSAPQDSEPSG